MAYADLIINSTSQTLDRMFLYAVPQDLTVAVGDLVQVPFG